MTSHPSLRPAMRQWRYIIAVSRYPSFPRPAFSRFNSSKIKPNDANTGLGPTIIAARARSGGAITRTLFVAFSLITFSHVFLKYVYSIDSTWGISMLPTISASGDWVVIDKSCRRGKGVQVGDLVSFRHPVRPQEFGLKRVIGLGGDLVLMNTPEKSDAMIQVPRGHCWVVGDNLPHSRDSRMFGPLPLALVQGKIIAKFSSATWFWFNPRSWWRSSSWITNGVSEAPDDENLD